MKREEILHKSNTLVSLMPQGLSGDEDDNKGGDDGDDGDDGDVDARYIIH